MPSKVQKLRGDFTFQKSGWPKVEYPNVSTGLIRDYRAEDLTDGPVTEWTDRIVGAKFITAATSGFTDPVSTFEDGRRSLVFAGKSRMDDQFVVSPDFSIAVVYHATSEGHSSSMRLISGADGFRYLSPTINTMSAQVATNPSAQRITVASVNAPGLVRDQWGAAVLSHSNAKTLAVKVLGGTYVKSTVLQEPQPVVQTRVILGANSGVASNNITGFYGKVVRVMVWDRALAPVDMDAVLVQNKKIYNLP